ncbi:MAG: sulfate reduction electron transfer complex DsrMKJOP subunit DsrO [Nitrospirota bacterium]
MSINRREFLKIAGISTILAIGGMSATNVLKRNWLDASQVLPDPKALIGKKWAMVVDMTKFKTEDDYKRVINACHRIHNVPDIGNPKHEIKWIWEETFEHTFPGQEHEYMGENIKHQPFLVLCNHCDNPACVRVCPTKATYKRSDGIVMMDMHRCIGCRFCMAACPFGARSFNWINPRPFIKEENKEFPTRMKGVVEKCTFCYERLAKGLKPACVEESNGGLIFGDLEDPESDVRKVLHSSYTIRRKPELGTQPKVYYII